MLKERPILFNVDMVRALLDGRKTQTRRIVKPTKDRNGSGCQLAPCEIAGEVNGGDYSLCPYGRPGDQLWVREAFEVGLCTESTLAYRATHKPSDLDEGWYEPIKWRPSIHMPRWASRITLEIVSVRVERLQDISEADALAEGIEPPEGETYRDYAVKPEDNEGHDYYLCPQDSFISLWEKINGLESCKANPWVWVVEFKCLEASQ